MVVFYDVKLTIRDFRRRISHCIKGFFTTKRSRSFKKRVIFSVGLIWLFILCYIGFLVSFSKPDYFQSREIIQLTDSERELLSSIETLKDNQLLNDELSKIVQNKIANIQKSANCSDWNFICTLSNRCGFGCQIHHRVACLMISFALNLPLIHNENDGWAYSVKWRDIFHPLGANCTPGSKTYRWEWTNYYLKNLDRYGSRSYFGLREYFGFDVDVIKYPLHDGLPVSTELANLVEKISPNIFLWWVGQFMKYSLRTRNHIEEKLSRDKKSIGFKNPIVGLHIRRTDKITEDLTSYHEIDEYMSHVDSYFKEIETHNQSIQRNVFLASDDSSVLSNAQKSYPEWNIIGFPSNVTFETEKSRGNSLYEILRDVIVLSECDFVICGLTSNVCRLLLEILSYKHLNATKILKSLDGKYGYFILYHHLHNPRTIKA